MTLLFCMVLVLFLGETLRDCRICLADDGTANGQGAAPDAGSRPQSKDSYQKYLMDKDHRSMLLYLGFPPDIVEKSEVLSTELIKSVVEIRRPDCVFRMGDKSILIVEFQSTASDLDIIRFMEYAVLLAAKISKAEGWCVPVRVTVIYSADIGSKPRHSYLNESQLEASSLQFKIFQIYLEDLIDLPLLVNEIGDEIAEWDPKNGTFSLSPEKLAKLYLAPLGRTPKLPSTASEEYLELGRVLSEHSGDPYILATMLFAVRARGNIITGRVENKYEEVLRNMGIDTAEYADLITKGKYSEYREKSETLAAENMTLVKENTTKDAKISFLAAENTTLAAENTTLVAESTAKDAKAAAFTTTAVLAMRSNNNTVEEISKKLKLSMADVARILEESIEKT